MKTPTLLGMGALFLASSLAVWADDPTTILFDRGLPTANLNDAAGPLRCNVAWADWEASVDPKTGYPAEYWVPGDDFTISTAGKYKIKTIRVWIVGDVSAGGGQGHDDGDNRPHDKAHLTLWGGTVSSGVGPISSSYAVTPVKYSDGSDYQGSSGAFRQINQVDFSVNVELRGGETFTFFVDGPWKLYVPSDPNGGYVNASLHASNRLLSVSKQEGANDWFLWLHRNGGTTVGIDTWNSETGAGTLCPPDSPCPGLDKPSDGNVQVFGRLQGGHD